MAETVATFKSAIAGPGLIKQRQVRELAECMQERIQEEEAVLQLVDLTKLEKEWSNLQKPKTVEDLRSFHQKRQDLSTQITHVVDAIKSINQCARASGQAVDDFTQDVEKTFKEAEAFMKEIREGLAKLANDVSEGALVRPALRNLCSARLQEAKRLQTSIHKDTNDEKSRRLTSLGEELNRVAEREAEYVAQGAIPEDVPEFQNLLDSKERKKQEIDEITRWKACTEEQSLEFKELETCFPPAKRRLLSWGGH
eukprot:gnl/MRDRNA2_/MRDRNA2_33418_c0_seq1.p1 gnl/MRDRNA2_/MRDRNA2_33418_c0~~gnl/MRDRNA2_/MRDRNA2_33418_c0_seq1.p1  ORF type:complete len:254 (+),score=65.78 gnl/MRDRNA2_/MRDRNA2_33418_c0_seq1:98-859(+)